MIEFGRVVMVPPQENFDQSDYNTYAVHEG
jgi:hypothetical protein